MMDTSGCLEFDLLFVIRVIIFIEEFLWNVDLEFFVLFY